ncbi:MAG: bifunctional folylpolyglutamate synthase/dihydrofolate synthase [Clostridia bacterium]|nr:bifunctional folylpolyglutamate synthase/dihydrofolate synthase [Clostridia bacterium]
MTKNYRDPHSFHNVVRLGLERISLLLDNLGRPDKDLRFIHVAGTNGKGSVCAFIESALVCDGKRVGKFTSPNLVKVNERICINGKQISDAELDFVLTAAENAAKKVETATGEAPTQFEIWCGAAMLCFAQNKCDIVVLEVGLGGEFDATNVIKRCELAVICHIDIDHTSYLGNTITEIARAKCGIIKDDITTRTVVTCEQDDEAMAVIKESARSHGHRLVVAKTPEAIGFDGICEHFRLPAGELVILSLGGEYQLANASLATKALEVLGVEAESIKKGLMSACHPGRFERIRDNVIFDGGHNPDGVRALCRALDRYFPNTPMNIIYACMADKDVQSTLELLNRDNREFIFTTVQDNPRAMSPDDLCKLARKCAGINGVSAPTLTDALTLAEKNGRLTIICGSLYLYADLK